MGMGTGFGVKHEATVENMRPMRVVVVGAGFSGILAAIRIPERLRNVELVVYEKSPDVGGVWSLNKYPGVACDVPSHSYQYTFAPNPHWSNLYAPGSEIRQYLQDTAEKFGATRFIKTSHKVEHGEWDAADKKWKINVKNLATGETFNDEANILISARGQLNEIAWPQISGLQSFKGKIMHSGEWDTSYDFRNKKIAVIGNGSSAIQIVPQLQAIEGTSLTCFMRSPTWISSAFGDDPMRELGLDPSNTAFSEEQRAALAKDPELYLRWRKAFEDGGNLAHDTTIMGHEIQKAGQEAFRLAMETKLATRPDLVKLIIPSFAPGCRRLTPGKGFLEALLEKNVEVVSTGIEKITEDSVVLNGGQEVKPDVIVCATGFHVSTAPPFPLIGKDGLSLAKRWEHLPETYLSLAVDGFPNLLMMFGPNSAIGFGSLTKMFEAEAEYILAVIRKLQKEDYASMEPKAERVKDFGEFVRGYFKNTVYLDKCRSWYRRGDEVVGLWPGSTLHALEALRSPRWEDWIYESVGGETNGLRWLGNGWSDTQKNGDPSWYLNPNEVEMPVEKTPEENLRYKARPWSY
ncbi:hypothetical protein QBC35DRAFT_523186 [Podospora australis]|uniref:FAD/NAD(P)-binding domain-containing protein n=1 Tax=Podospora australis TaxID=1536484 RepID=A0AAN6WV98_9PEZI|nr:hypothetical protein QBC35DRAFT_523186 [Podospora australis]